jgi:hypothetical protein
MNYFGDPFCKCLENQSPHPFKTVKYSCFRTVKRPEARALREGCFGGVGLVGVALREFPGWELVYLVGQKVAGSSWIPKRKRFGRNTSPTSIGLLP